MNDLTPETALQLYLDDKSKTAAESTIQSHSDRLSHFVGWFNEETDYEYLHELDGMDIRLWRVWRFDSDEHSDAYIKAVQDSLRVFLRFCRDVEAVDAQLPEKVHSPDGGQQRSNEIPADRAIHILEYLDRFEYASLDHTLFHLLWYGLLRVGGARAIDLDDIDFQNDRIELHHRPESGTTLKNGRHSERTIAIRPTTREILRDYVDTHRENVTDEYGREPLFSTEHGRAHQNTLRNRIYAVTRPCLHRDCPHDTDPDSCDAARRRNWACECPSSESTHAIRRGSISWHLRQETPKQIVSDRADVEPDVLSRHYSSLTDGEKAEVRRGELPDELGEV
ncbi:tyrosine-type recombinase/integrase [Haloarcula rubripromontorii]|uniref:tyrosine-type recombinase/integrase n=1 Tax=Haloarcula rubripromontorii TaxID=1705562 RepID=UPI00345B713F